MISLIFDNETTGIPLHPTARPEVQPRIVEWGGILVNSRGEILEEFGMLVNPEYVIPDGEKIGKLLDAAGVLKISGIVVEDLAEEPTWGEAAATIRPYYEKADQVIAHNLPFDHSMVELENERCGIEGWPWPDRLTCTVEEHLQMFGYRIREKDLYEYYTGVPLDQTHRAMDDAKALLEICKASGVLV